ncbi:MAG TPA: alkaline phosphatase family protein [Bryobacteraceae bacterium]|nr:alkaline phosphatase family protein [Bryobacteraceae bacterium]
MKRLLVLGLLISCTLHTAPRKPKLVVAVIFDQFRYDYLTRYRAEYHAGFDRLLTKGAVFTNARYEHYPTVTAVGHSTYLTGATPAISGIVGNTWFDRTEGKTVTSVNDSTTRLVGGDGEGSSPRKLLIDTIGDELKKASAGKSKVIGISHKDRAAILPSGHSADAAYWFLDPTGGFVTSTYYENELPAWAREFNASRPCQAYAGRKWLDHTLPVATGKICEAVTASPFGNDLLEQFAERALAAEQLGKHDATDLLTVSFSSNDVVGHQFGPDSPEVHELCVTSDRILGKLIAAVERQVGPDGYLLVVSADHGVAPTPEANAALKMPGGRLTGNPVAKAVEAALGKRYGDAKWVTNIGETGLYLNLEAIESKKLDRGEVDSVAAEAAMSVNHVFRVYTREQLMNNRYQDDSIGRRVLNGFFPQRSPDVEVVLDPYWITSSSGASHSTPFGYDTHVPVVFLGASIKPGHYDEAVMVNDVAPTLATLLAIETPSGSVGRALSEIYAQ